jgi:hypothetical protein
MTNIPYSLGKKIETCKRGPIYTDKPWKRPTQDMYNIWLTELNKYSTPVDTNMYVCGKFIENIEETWDIDIILSDPLLSENDTDKLLKIRDFMIYAMQIGHDLDLFIDMKCYIPYKEDGTFWYSPDDYIENGNMNCKIMSVFTDTIVNNKTLRREQNIITSKELTTDLYLIEREVPSKKHIERIQNNINYYEPVFVKRI